MNVIAQVEPLSIALPEIRTLIDRHYDELSLHRERGFPLRPQFHVYAEREVAGFIICITLRNDRSLIGYKVGFVAPGLHYETCLTALPDLFFIAPEHRGGFGALKLFRCYEAELRRRGVHLWSDSMKLGKGVPGTERLFLALGFEAVETHFAKWLT